VKRSTPIAIASLVAGSLLLAACGGGAGTDVVEVTPEPTTTTAPATPEPTEQESPIQEEPPVSDTDEQPKPSPEDESTVIVGNTEVSDGDTSIYPNPDGLIPISEVPIENRSDFEVDGEPGQGLLVPTGGQLGNPSLESKWNVVFDNRYFTTDASLLNQNLNIISTDPENLAGWGIVISPEAPQGKASLTYTYTKDGSNFGGEITVNVQ
jgi:predicted small secreted protein